jgi:hypothetical protein
LCKLDKNLSKEFVLRKVYNFKLFQIGNYRGMRPLRKLLEGLRR